MSAKGSRIGRSVRIAVSWLWLALLVGLLVGPTQAQVVGPMGIDPGGPVYDTHPEHLDEFMLDGLVLSVMPTTDTQGRPACLLFMASRVWDQQSYYGMTEVDAVSCLNAQPGGWVAVVYPRECEECSGTVEGWATPSQVLDQVWKRNLPQATRSGQ